METSKYKCPCNVKGVSVYKDGVRKVVCPHCGKVKWQTKIKKGL